MTPPPPSGSFLHVVFAGVVPREGGDAETTEDCFAIAHHDGFLRASVADGAGDGIFADRWAQLWAENWVSNNRVCLAQLRRLWRESFSDKPLPWHMQARAAHGAALAYIGVHVLPSGEWSASGIGDCMLFQVGEGKVGRTFPYCHVDDFPDLPLLLHTNPIPGDYNTELEGRHSAEGTLKHGDELLLMSDALAYWFLKETSENKNPYNWLSHLSTPETFRERVRQLRMSSRLKDDDTTLVHLRYVGD